MSNLSFMGSPLPESWTEGVVADVTSKVGSGATPRGGASVYVKSGTAFIRSQNVHDHEFRPEGLVYISDEAADQLRGVTVQPGDVLLNITGDSILRTCIAPPTLWTARVSQHVAIVRPNDRVEPRFLQKWLSLPAMKDYMLGHSSGGTRKAITKGHLLSFPMALPPLEEQRAIAETLATLDDKIESNRRAVELIDDVARAEFRRVLATSGVTRTPIAELASVTKGVSYRSADLVPSRTSLVTLKSFDRDGGYKRDGLKQYAGPYKPEQAISPGELAVAQTDLTQGAEVVGRAIRVPSDVTADVLVASLDLAIVRPRADLSPEYLFGVLTDIEFREHCRARTSGTTVLHLAADAIPSYVAPIASPAARASFTAVARPLIERSDSLNRESLHLEQLRDALLPELLSGRLRVPMSTA